MRAWLQRQRDGRWTDQHAKATIRGREILFVLSAPDQSGRLLLRAEVARNDHVIWRSSELRVTVRGAAPTLTTGSATPTTSAAGPTTTGASPAAPTESGGSAGPVPVGGTTPTLPSPAAAPGATPEQSAAPAPALSIQPQVQGDAGLPGIVGQALIVSDVAGGLEPGDYGSTEPDTNLQNMLESLGYSVTLESSFPANLQQYSSVWYVGVDPIDQSDQVALENYVRSGGGLYLTGERVCCQALDSTDQSIVEVLTGLQGITVGDDEDLDSGSISLNSVNPNAIDGITRSPNTVTAWYPSAPGAILGLSGQNVLTEGYQNGQSVATGAAWDASEVQGGRGHLVLLMDINWLEAEFDSLQTAQQFVQNIEGFLTKGGSQGGAQSSAVQIRNRAATRCLDANAGTIGSNGTKVQLWDCTGQSNQNWVFEPNGSIQNVAGGRCLGIAPGVSGTDGTALQLWNCDGSANQTWTASSSGTITNAATGLVLDADTGTINSDGTKVQVWSGTAGLNQSWYTAPASGVPQLATYTYCPKVGPASSLGTQGYVYPCMTVTDAVDGVSASPRSIQAPSNATCPGYKFWYTPFGSESVGCNVQGKPQSSWNGTANVDVVVLHLTWNTDVPTPGGDVIIVEDDTDTLKVITSPTGVHSTSKVAVCGPQQPCQTPFSN